MSYASVAARNAPPPSQQPQPDPALLEGHSHSDQAQSSPNEKVTVVPHETAADLEDKGKKASSGLKADARKAAGSAKARLDKGEKKLHDPKVQAGLATAVNLLALGGVGLLAYKNWGKERWDRRVVSATVIGLGALFGSQGYLGWLFYGQK